MMLFQLTSSRGGKEQQRVVVHSPLISSTVSKQQAFSSDFILEKTRIKQSTADDYAVAKYLEHKNRQVRNTYILDQEASESPPTFNALP